MRKKKGVTLIELMIIVAIMGIGFLVVSNMFSLVVKTNKIANDEFDLQSKMRITSQELNKRIRFTPAVFTLKKETFEKPKKSGWGYFGIEDVKDKSGNVIGKQVVEYSPVEKEEVINGEKVITYKSTGTEADHDKRVLIASTKGIDINMYFDKNLSDKNSKILDFVIEGVEKGSLEKKMSISTKLQALNAVVVEHEGNPAVAIAYRSEVPGKKVKVENEAYAVITLTLDISGSMNWTMDAKKDSWGDYIINYERINALNERTNKLISELKSAGDKIYIYIAPYSSRAFEYDKPLTKFQNIKDVGTVNYTASGGTNTGEALLRAYEMMTNKSPVPAGAAVNYYNILLTDGEPQSWTEYLLKGDKSGPYSKYPKQDMNNMCESIDKYSLFGKYKHTDYYFFRDKWTVDVGGYKYKYNSAGGIDYASLIRGMKYVKRIGKDYISASPLNIKSYIIGFGSEKDKYGENRNEKLSKEIASYCVGYDTKSDNPVNKDGKTAYYSAESSEKLDIIYNELKEIIKGDMWHVMGPYGDK